VLNYNNEEWKTIKDFPNYEVSNLGNVRNSRGKIMKTYQINSGYQAIKLVYKGTRGHKLIHRLVALTWIPNDNGLATEVNHIDGNKMNNSVENLEWLTSADNKKHARAIGLSEYNKPTLGLKHKSKASKYHNVGKVKDKWVATVRYQGKNYYQKRFDSEEAAAKHVNWILDTLGLGDRPRNIII
jgi:hypothetical protein